MQQSSVTPALPSAAPRPRVAQRALTLESPRHHIRPWRPEDAALWLDAWRDAPAPGPFDGPRPTPEQLTEATFARTQSGLRQLAERDELYHLCVCTRDDPARYVGQVLISKLVRGSEQSARLGYEIQQPFRRQGRASELLPPVITMAWEVLGLHRLEAIILVENAPSRALIERLGFRLEGVSARRKRVDGQWRDVCIYAITSEEWPPRP